MARLISDRVLASLSVNMKPLASTSFGEPRTSDPMKLMKNCPTSNLPVASVTLAVINCLPLRARVRVPVSGSKRASSWASFSFLASIRKLLRGSHFGSFGSMLVEPCAIAKRRSCGSPSPGLRVTRSRNSALRPLTG